MKSIRKILMLFIGFAIFVPKLTAQSDTLDYLGQEPPGYYPEKFAPGMFSSNEWGPVFSPDGNELFYTWQNPNGSQDYHIKYRKKTNGIWSEAVPAPFTDVNGTPELEPNFTPDGKKLYFDSERAGGFGGADIWYVIKTDTGWSNPVNAGSGINTSDNENFPSFTLDTSMYFCSDRNNADWDIDIYIAKYDSGLFQNPIRLSDSINTNGWDACPTAFDDILIFESTPALGFGKGDLCYSQISDGNYSVAELMSANFNSKSSEMGIVLSPDRKYLFFKHLGEPDIYWVDTEVFDYLGAREAPFNYVTSWYAGIGEQMKVALHPHLVKRRVMSETTDSPISYNSMISLTNSCTGCIENIKKGRKDITLLHEGNGIATAKVLSDNFFDYLHLVKFDGYWKVINVAWDYYDSSIGDSAKLVAVLENYMDYWQAGDDEQMDELIHPLYSGGLALSHSEAHRVNKAQLLSLVSDCMDCIPDKDFNYEILDIYLNTACVKISINDSIEYLHFSYQNNKWFIINALRNFNFDPARNYNLATARIDLTHDEIIEGLSVETEIGQLQVNVPADNRIKFSLYDSGNEENDNDDFSITGNTLFSNNTFDYQDKNEYRISVRAIINNMDTLLGIFTIHVKTDPLSIAYESRNELVTVYPNPTHEDLIICLTGIEKAQSISVISMEGKTIMVNDKPYSKQVHANMSQLADGMYIIKIKYSGGVIYKKVIVER